jgi:hypothetical protein
LDLEPKEIELTGTKGEFNPNYIYDLAQEGWEEFIS